MKKQTTRKRIFPFIVLLISLFIGLWAEIVLADNLTYNVTVPGINVVKAMAAGFYHTVALKDDGSVVAWGDNNYGQTTVPSGLSGVTAIAAGFYHTVALKNDGSVVAWGDNETGQATVPSGLSGVKAIAAGYYHTVALKNDGSVVAWGSNSFGQTTVPSGLSGVKAIAAGYYHTVALKNDGSVVAWGSNSSGQCNVPSGLSGVTAIAAGYFHTIALKGDGSVVAWGSNNFGQITIPSGLSGVTAITTGYFHTVALKNDGSVVVWGNNALGQTTVPAGLSGVTAIAAGGQHTVAMRNNGTFVAWGYNNKGQTTHPSGLGIAYGTIACESPLPNGTDSLCVITPDNGYMLSAFSVNGVNKLANVSNNRYTIANVQEDQAVTGAFVLGATHTISGKAGVAGATMNYFDGIPKTVTSDTSGNYNIPVSYNWSGTVTPTKAGYTFSPAKMDYSNVLDNQSGKDFIATPIVYTISGNAGVADATISYADVTASTVKTDTSGNYSLPVSYNWSGTVTPTKAGYTFSPAKMDYSNVLANQSSKDFIASPFRIVTVPGINVVRAMAAGFYHTVALKDDGSVVAWGDNKYGQTTVPSGLSGVTAIAAGFYHTVALKNDGSVVAWGDNETGQATVPSGLSGVKAIAAGYYHTVALKNDGSVVAWGSNNFGQATVPSGLSGVKAIAAGYYHTVALKNDGSVVAWGSNSSGQCNVPSGLSGVTAIAAGYFHTIALKGDGSVVAWGSNNFGQITIPSGLAGVTAITTGYFHTVALKNDGSVVVWGNNALGQTTVPAGLSGVTAIAAGGQHTVAMRNNGTFVAWGYNNKGQTTHPSGLGIAYGTIACESPIPNGTDSLCVITPDNGYMLSAFSVNGENKLANVSNNRYTIANVQADQAVTGAFVLGATHTISGKAGVAEATMNYFDGTPRTVTSDTSGNYSLPVSYNWSGTVTPSKTGYTFDPVNKNYTNITANQTNQDYLAPNKPPTSNNLSLTINANQSIQVALSSTDMEADSLTYNIIPPMHGQLSGDAPNLVYTPNQNYIGTDTFTYTASDAYATSNIAIVNIIIYNTKVNIKQEFTSPTNSHSVNFTINGEHIMQYKYKIDNGQFSEPLSVSTPLAFATLPEGSHTLKVIGKNTIDYWQSENDAATISWVNDYTPPELITTPYPAPGSLVGTQGGDLPIRFVFGDALSGVDAASIRLRDVTAGKNTDITGSCEISSNSLSFTLKGPHDGSYEYIFQAQDVAGNLFTKALPFTFDATAPISTPSIKGGHYTNTIPVTITTNEPATIYYSTDGYPPFIGADNTTRAQAPATGITFTKTGKLQYFSVDAAGNAEQTKSEVYILTIPTDPVTGLTAQYNGQTGKIDLSWTAPAGQVQEYRIYRTINSIEKDILSESRTGQYSPPAKLRLAVSSATNTIFSDSDVQPGITYTYGVTAVVGQQEGIISDFASASIADTVLAKNKQEAIGRGINWLLANQHTEGYWGEKKEIRMLSTSQALNALRLAGVDNAGVRKALFWLRGQYADNNDYLARQIMTLSDFGQNVDELVNRLMSQGLANGTYIYGWGTHKRYRIDAMSTSLGVLALKRSAKTQSLVTACYSSFTDTYSMCSRESDKFGWVSGKEPSVYVSALAYNVLNSYYQYKVIDDAWIIDSKKSDGSFGNGLVDTAGVLLWINDLAENVKGEATNYLISRQSIAGSWQDDPYLSSFCLETLLKH